MRGGMEAPTRHIAPSVEKWRLEHAQGYTASLIHALTNFRPQLTLIARNVAFSGASGQASPSTYLEGPPSDDFGRIPQISEILSQS
jgi:hypothetical protein